jgi:hypothetical protein
MARQKSLPHASHLPVPYIVHCCIEWLRNNSLDVQGIFRTSGSFEDVNSLVTTFDTSEGTWADVRNREIG